MRSHLKHKRKEITFSKNSSLPIKEQKATIEKKPIINAINLDSNVPIPLEHYGHAFISRKGRRYVPFLEPLDNFAQLLLEAKLLSPTQMACINSKTQYSIGAGWYLKNTEVDERLNTWAKSLNRKGQTLNDILKAIFDNLHTVGNSFIEIIRGKIGSTKFIKVYVNSFLDCRLSMPEDKEIPISVFKSPEFRKQGIWNMRDNEFVEIPLYTGDSIESEWLKDDNGNEHTMLHLKNEVSGYDYYGMPSSIACLPQQILEYKAARYNIDNFDNNLVIGGVVLLQGNLSQDEADKLGAKIVQQHAGDGKRGRYVVLSSQSGIDNSKIIPFDKERDGDFIEFDKRIEEKIISANNWDAFLAGIHRQGSLSNGGNNYRSIFSIKNTTVIEPMQAYVMEKFIYPLMKICDEWMKTKWSEHEIGVKPVMPISFIGDLDINAIITKNEGRAAIGLTAYDGKEGSAFIKENKSTAFNNEQSAMQNN